MASGVGKVCTTVLEHLLGSDRVFQKKLEKRSTDYQMTGVREAFASITLPNSVISAQTLERGGHPVWGRDRWQMTEGVRLMCHRRGIRMMSWNAHPRETRENPHRYGDIHQYWNLGKMAKHQGRHINFESLIGCENGNVIIYFPDTHATEDLPHLLTLGVPVILQTLSPKDPGGSGVDYTWTTSTIDGVDTITTWRGGTETERFQQWTLEPGFYVIPSQWRKDLKWRISKSQWGHWYRDLNTNLIVEVQALAHPSDPNRKLVCITPVRRVRKFKVATLVERMPNLRTMELLDTVRCGYISRAYNMEVKRKDDDSGETSTEMMRVVSISRCGDSQSIRVPTEVHSTLISYCDQQRTSDLAARSSGKTASCRPYISSQFAGSAKAWNSALNPTLTPTTAGHIFFQYWLAGAPKPSDHDIPKLLNMSDSKRIHFVPTAKRYDQVDQSKEYARVFGPQVFSVTAVCPAMGINSDTDAIAERIEKIANTVVPPDRFDEYAADMLASLIPNMHVGMIKDVEEVLEQQDGKAQKMRNERERDKMIPRSKKAIVSLFVKSEFYGGVNNPRAISVMPTDHSIETAQLILAFKEEILELTEWYMCGKKPKSIAMWLHQISMNFYGRPFILFDFSRMDGHISQWINENIDRAGFLRWASPEFHDFVNKLIDREAQAPGTSKFGVPYNSGWARKSGSSINSPNHTMLSLFLVYATLREKVILGKKAYTQEEAWKIAQTCAAYCGDDVAVVSPYDGFCQDAMAVAKRLGMKLRSEEIPYGAPFIFLGRLFLNPAKSLISIQDPERTIVKLHATVSNPQIPLWVAAKNKATGYLVNDANTAIIGPYCKLISQLVDNWASQIDSTNIADWKDQLNGTLTWRTQASEDIFGGTVGTLDADETAKDWANKVTGGGADYPYWSGFTQGWTQAESWPTFEKIEDSYSLVAKGLSSMFGAEISPAEIITWNDEITHEYCHAHCGSMSRARPSYFSLPRFYQKDAFGNVVAFNEWFDGFHFDVPFLPRVRTEAIIGDQFVQTQAQEEKAVRLNATTATHPQPMLIEAATSIKPLRIDVTELEANGTNDFSQTCQPSDFKTPTDGAQLDGGSKATDRCCQTTSTVCTTPAVQLPGTSNPPPPSGESSTPATALLCDAGSPGLGTIPTKYSPSAPPEEVVESQGTSTTGGKPTKGRKRKRKTGGGTGSGAEKSGSERGTTTGSSSEQGVDGATPANAPKVGYVTKPAVVVRSEEQDVKTTVSTTGTDSQPSGSSQASSGGKPADGQNGNGHDPPTGSQHTNATTRTAAPGVNRPRGGGGGRMRGGGFGARSGPELHGQGRGGGRTGPRTENQVSGMQRPVVQRRDDRNGFVATPASQMEGDVRPNTATALGPATNNRGTGGRRRQGPYNGHVQRQMGGNGPFRPNRRGGRNHYGVGVERGRGSQMQHSSGRAQAQHLAPGVPGPFIA